MSKKKYWRVNASPEITKLNAGRGSRRRAGLVFTSTPVYLDHLPKAIASDSMLVKSEITAKEFATLPVKVTPVPTEMKASRIQKKPADPVEAPETFESLEALNYQAMKKLAGSLKIGTGGKATELQERIAAHLGLTPSEAGQGADGGAGDGSAEGAPPEGTEAKE